MRTEPLPTQVEDIERIIEGEDVPNFSEPGTGKTLNTIGCIEATSLYSGLVICPTVATLMWTRLLMLELGAVVQHLATKDTAIDKKADFLVASYGVLDKHHGALLERDNLALIIDECQAIKNHESLRARLIMGEDCDGIGGIYETSQQCWLLSGTPIERYADDLWSQLRATQPEALTKYRCLTLEDFRLQYCQMAVKSLGGYGGASKVISVGNTNEMILKHMLYKEIGAVRRTMKEVDPYMPPVVEREIFVKTTKNKELIALLKNMSMDDLINALLKEDIHIAQARRLMGLSKLRSGVDYIKMESRNHPVLVGYWHEDVGREIYMQLTASSYAANLIGGATSVEARERIRQRFINGELNVLVGQIQAMGVAMDGLQEASNHVIMFENDWSAAKVEQFYKRLARKGQVMHTQVDFLKCDMTLEEAIDNIRKRKEEGTKLILG